MDGPPASARAAQVLATLNRVIAKARKRGMPVIFIQHNGPKGSPLEPGQDGWKLHSALERHESDAVIRKSFSDCFHATTLAATLSRLGAEALWITGYATDFCVASTVNGAAFRGFPVTVIADAHTTKDRPHAKGETLIDHYNWVWSNLGAPAPIRVVPCDELP
ncbi:hydrolase [Paludibacterium paludis]|uniref:Hydrolase n=2 Tax=Paludibacterium paludis TaxID=1225769 RepID=A0A918U7G1_9NEIS|nr:hydrolase [Paludibacterium paludis]